jgi:hypothetical protein
MRLLDRGWVRAAIRAALCVVTLLSAGCPPGLFPPPDGGGHHDAGAADAGTYDAGTLDAGASDAGTADAGAADAGAGDAGSVDAGASDAGTPDGGAADAGPSADLAPPLGGWTFRNPLPFGDDVQALWSQARGVAWAAATRRILRHDDSGWSAFDVGDSTPNTSISGFSATDLWTAAGRGNVQHWDGQRFSSVQAPNLRVARILATGPGQAWATGIDAVSGRGELLQFSSDQDEGPVFDLSFPGQMGAIFQAGQEVWAVENNPAAPESLVVRVSPAGYTWQAVPGSGGLAAGWAASEDDAWLASNGDHAFLHWDGAQARFTPYPMPQDSDVTAMWGSGPGDIYAVGATDIAHWDGARWSVVVTTVYNSLALRAVSGSSATDVWFAGDDGILLRFDGERWHDLSPAPRPFLLGAVFARTADDVWAVGSAGTALHWNGASWSPFGTNTRADFTSVWAAAADDAWATAIGQPGQPGLLRWDGAVWTPSSDPAMAGLQILSLSGSSRSDVWAAPESPLSPPMHFDGERWSASAGPRLSWLQIVATSATDVWALPDLGATDDPARLKLWRFDGRSWTGVDSPTTSRVTSIWATGPDDAWALSDSPLAAFHWDGRSWTQVELFFGADARVLAPVRVWSGRPDDVWVTTASGWFAHYDGARFTPQFLIRGFFAVHGTPGETVWAVGRGGEIISTPAR